MTDRLTQAFTCGYYARDNARPVESCPTFAISDLGRPERQAWVEGWKQRDRELRNARLG